MPRVQHRLQQQHKTCEDVGCKTLRLDKAKVHGVSEKQKSAQPLSLRKRIPVFVDNISSKATDSNTDSLKVLCFITMKNLPVNLFKDMIDRYINANMHLAKHAFFSSWDTVDDLLTTLIEPD